MRPKQQAGSPLRTTTQECGLVAGSILAEFQTSAYNLFFEPGARFDMVWAERWSVDATLCRGTDLAQGLEISLKPLGIDMVDDCGSYPS